MNQTSFAGQRVTRRSFMCVKSEAANWPGPMDLIERDLLGWTLGGSPRS